MYFNRWTCHSFIYLKLYFKVQLPHPVKWSLRKPIGKYDGEHKRERFENIWWCLNPNMRLNEPAARTSHREFSGTFDPMPSIIRSLSVTLSCLSAVRLSVCLLSCRYHSFNNRLVMCHQAFLAADLLLRNLRLLIIVHFKIFEVWKYIRDE